MDSGNMETAGAFILKLAVFHHSLFAKNQFRNRIREMRRVNGADVTFENRHVTSLSDDNQVPWVCSRTHLRQGGNKQQMNWGLNRFAGRDVHESTILKKSGVQSRKRVL